MQRSHVLPLICAVAIRESRVRVHHVPCARATPRACNHRLRVAAVSLLDRIVSRAPLAKKAEGHSNVGLDDIVLLLSSHACLCVARAWWWDVAAGASLVANESGVPLSRCALVER